MKHIDAEVYGCPSVEIKGLYSESMELVEEHIQLAREKDLISFALYVPLKFRGIVYGGDMHKAVKYTYLFDGLMLTEVETYEYRFDVGSDDEYTILFNDCFYLTRIKTITLS